MLEHKRFFIFANQALSKRITDTFLVPMEVYGHSVLSYGNYGYCYHSDNEFTTMMKHHADTNLHMADYFIIDYSFIKEHHEVLQLLHMNYHKAIVCIFPCKEDYTVLQNQYQFSIYPIYMDTFDQDLKQCMNLLDGEGIAK